MEAAPRGPNHPRNATVGRRALVPSIEIATGSHPHEREAEDGVERDLPRQVAERRAEEDRTEDDEGDGGEHRAGLLHEVRDVAAAMPPEPAEHHPADEGSDEARASDRLGEAEAEKRSGERHDLEPGGIDEAATACVDDERRPPPRRRPRRRGRRSRSSPARARRRRRRRSRRPPLARRQAQRRRAGRRSRRSGQLSTLRLWRMRAGRRGDVTTVWPSAASVGARMIARTSASGHARSPRSARPTTNPARIVSGNPTPSRRAGIPSVRRSAFRSMRDASEKRTTASVASASVLTSTPVADGSTSPRASTPTTRPAAVKTIGAVIHVPSTRPEMAAKPRRMAASVASCQCTRGASQRPEATG